MSSQSVRSGRFARVPVLTVVLMAAAASGPGSEAVACTYSLSQTSDSLPAVGAISSFNLYTQDGCPWSAQSSANWIHTSSAESGGGHVSYTVDPNPLSKPRQGTITVQGQVFTITQMGGSCLPGFTPISAAHTSDPATGSFDITLPSSCLWAAGTAFAWIHTRSTGTGSGTVQYTVDSFAGPGTRTGTIDVLDQSFIISQSGPVVKPAIFPIEPQTLAAGTPSLPIPLALSAAFTDTSRLYISAASSNPSVLPNEGIFTGKIGGNWVMILAPAANAQGVSLVTLTVTDANGQTAIGSFTVIVGQPPAPGFTPSTSRLSSSGKFQTSLYAPVGQNVRLQTSTDLQTWTDAAVLSNTQGAMDYVDPTSATQSCRFYRFISQ